MANEKIPGVGFHHLAIGCADLDKSIAFYKAIGFTEIASWGEGASRAVMLDIGNGGIFELFANGTTEPQANERLLHFAFATCCADTCYASAMAAGAVSHMEPKDVDIQSDPVMKVRIAFVKGPDGELLEFFQYRKECGCGCC